VSVPIVRVRSARGEISRAEFLEVQDNRVRVRYLKEINGCTQEAWIDARRIIGEIPSTAQKDQP
jgi:hypothetical protein